jgi:hypothetical protein
VLPPEEPPVDPPLLPLPAVEPPELPPVEPPELPPEEEGLPVDPADPDPFEPPGLPPARLRGSRGLGCAGSGLGSVGACTACLGSLAVSRGGSAASLGSSARVSWRASKATSPDGTPHPEIIQPTSRPATTLNRTADVTAGMPTLDPGGWVLYTKASLPLRRIPRQVILGRDPGLAGRTFFCVGSYCGTGGGAGSRRSRWVFIGAKPTASGPRPRGSRGPGKRFVGSSDRAPWRAGSGPNAHDVRRRPPAAVVVEVAGPATLDDPGVVAAGRRVLHPNRPFAETAGLLPPHDEVREHATGLHQHDLAGPSALAPERADTAEEALSLAVDRDARSHPELVGRLEADRAPTRGREGVPPEIGERVGEQKSRAGEYERCH